MSKLLVPMLDVVDPDPTSQMLLLSLLHVIAVGAMVVLLRLE